MSAYDADLVEINPLAIVRETGADGAVVERLVCLDAKITLDDSALERHPGLEDLRDPDEEAPEDKEAREAGLTFIKLDGTIGCMVNGAGLAMTTMDLVKRAGGEPANFLDIGGGARADKVAAAMRLILADPKVNAILVNIFGGITRGDEVARGLIEARAQQTRDVPMVVRIVGTNAAEAAVLLEEARFQTAASLDDAAAKAVEASHARPGRAREHPRRARHAPGRAGHHRPRGRLSRPGLARVRHERRCRGHTRQGRPAGPGRQRARFDTVAEAVRETGANTSLHLRAGGRRPRCRHGGRRRRDRDDLLHHRGDPGARHDPRGRGRPRARRAPDRPELPRRHVARAGQGRDHPGLDPSRGPGRCRESLGHAHLRGGPGDDRRGPRPVDVCRDRRRSRSSGRRSSTCSSCSPPMPTPTRSC